jgi:hypothetical protein
MEYAHQLHKIEKYRKQKERYKNERMVCSHCKKAGHTIRTCGLLAEFYENVIAGNDAIQLIENISMVQAKYLLSKSSVSFRNIQKIMTLSREKMIDILFSIVVYNSFDENELNDNPSENVDFSLSEERRMEILKEVRSSLQTPSLVSAALAKGDAIRGLRPRSPRLVGREASFPKGTNEEMQNGLKIYETKEPFPKDDCPICLKEKITICQTNCKHSFCLECFNSVLKTSTNCPCCRTEIDSIYLYPHL